MSSAQTLRGAARPAGSAGSALRVRDFRLLWLGQVASFSGSWMQAVAQGCVILSLTRSPLALGLLTVTQFAPALLLSLFGGVLADRLPKRRLVIALQGAMLAQTVLLALLVTSGRLELWHLYLLAALAGCAGALVHSFFDFTLHTAANALLFLVLAALATVNGRVEESEADGHRRRRRRRREHAGEDAYGGEPAGAAAEKVGAAA